MTKVLHHPRELRIGDRVEECIIGDDGKSRWEFVGTVSRQGEGTDVLFTLKSNKTGQECFGRLDCMSSFFVTRELTPATKSLE